MTGRPMEAAIGLGLLVSELTHEAFRDRCLTFESTPQWVDLRGCTSLAEKVGLRAEWGGSTDFVAACAHPRGGGGGETQARRGPRPHRLLGHAVRPGGRRYGGYGYGYGGYGHGRREPRDASTA